MNEQTDRVLTLVQAADLCGIPTYKLRREIRAGRLQAVNVSTGTTRKHWRLKLSALNTYLAELGGEK